MKKLTIEKLELVKGAAYSPGYCALTGAATVASVAFGAAGILFGAVTGLYSDAKKCWNS
ncbi:hypothetical protein MHJ94_07540 [Chryseobacterium taklimakanense]|uniref:hypothetical protein n=1 Tax=Chryseobacterium taklimakanense TaxID=536441 RepID=UPI001EF5715A|nr:hypothetical protein [Chryseobacterium taklimakanense]MCG7281150.1 hypothetical protein [Chryseobacterium taklimakanense]